MIIWFLTAFVAGAGLYAVSRPSPAMHARVMEIKGGGLLERCRQTGPCGKAPAPQLDRPLPQLPPDMDRVEFPPSGRMQKVAPRSEAELRERSSGPFAGRTALAFTYPRKTERPA
jgi:hypothetical protein